MTNDEVLQKVAEIVRDTFEVDDVEISRATVANDIPGWDSLSHTILMLTMEQAFAIELADSTHYRNIGELVDRICKILN